MKRYVIEREVPGIGLNDQAGLCSIAKTSNAAITKLSQRVQWMHSYVTNDKSFCIYLADDETALREHARISGFPANKITLVNAVIDPTTAG
ncbi:MAG TPA: DUF4242 domain-containing protein [Devosia sp.]|jgi:hypothetical protein|nr:DUF4242 domain-containing protein [Devosia sp.]